MAALFAIDPRSLALFRILMGSLLLIDLWVRFGDLRCMYTDDGMFSRAEVCYRTTTVWNWSLHFGSGDAGYQKMLFAIAALLSASLLVGFKTRMATVGSWLLLVSIQHRVPAILSGAEILFRMLLLWGIFLPLGRVCSLDAWLFRRQRGGIREDGCEPVLSVGTAAIRLQMIWMYLFSAIFKTNAEWFHGGVVAGSLAHNFFAAPLGKSLLGYPNLLAILTWATFALEWLGPLLLLVPKCPWRLRLAVILSLAAMHLGICLTLEVGMFSYVSMAGLTVFLPSELWRSRVFHLLAPKRDVVLVAREASPNSAWASWAEGVCATLLFYVFLVNVNGLPSHPLAPLTPERWKPLTTTLGLAQRWGMFEAAPSKSGWYVARARLRDGSEVDLLRKGAAVDWAKPEFPTRLYPNGYWVKLFREMAYFDEQGYQVYRAPVARFLCRQWNESHLPDQQIEEFDFVYCMETGLDGKPFANGQIVFQPLVHLDYTGPWPTEITPEG